MVEDVNDDRTGMVCQIHLFGLRAQKPDPGECWVSTVRNSCLFFSRYNQCTAGGRLSRRAFSAAEIQMLQTYAHSTLTEDRTESDASPSFRPGV